MAEGYRARTCPGAAVTDVINLCEVALSVDPVPARKDLAPARRTGEEKSSAGPAKVNRDDYISVPSREGVPQGGGYRIGYLIYMACKVSIQGGVMFRRRMCLAVLGGLATTFGVFAGAAASSASTAPSGQVMYGNTTFDTATGHFVGGGGTIEPGYNDTTGTLVYFQTPNNSTVNPNDHNVAPFYVPVYPVGSGIDPATLTCAHQPADNCPDHGPPIAGAAMAIDPGVYGRGVLGHDHLAGIASSSGDFNIIWEPTLVLFTNAQAARQHITTLAQINADLASGNAFLVPLPQLDFHCSVVSAAAYARGTPAPTVVGP